MQFSLPDPPFINYFCHFSASRYRFMGQTLAAGAGILQCGGDHKALQPSVKRRVEHGFLRLLCILGKVLLSFKYEEKEVLFLPSFFWMVIICPIFKASCYLSSLTKPADLPAVHNLFSM